MERSKVYQLFDGERDYQEIKWEGKDDSKTSVSEWLNYIEYQLHIAKKKIYHLDKIGALEEVRKIGALATVCLEYNDCPARKIESNPEMFMNDVNGDDNE